MKRKIYASMMLLAILSILLSAGALCVIFYSQYTSVVRFELRERAQLLKDLSPDALETYAAFHIAGMRLTLISPDGIVLYDDARDATALPNHADRKEFQEALSSGSGESKRYSDTLRQETYYYAVKLSGGSVLRLSKTTNSIWGTFRGILPYVVLIIFALVLVGYLLAGRLTNRIVRPINRFDPERELSTPYDELAPFVRTISQQRRRINEHLTDLQNRSDTIEAIMANMKEGILFLNRQGEILSLNKSALAIFQVTEDIQGKSILELLRSVELLDNIRNALGGRSGDMYFEHNGKMFQVFFSPAADDGALILFLDITEKAQAEKIRREFSANVSHELKTPLTNISGYAEMIATGLAKKHDVQGFGRKIGEETARLIALIEGIIMLSELDESHTLTLEPVDVASVAAEVKDALALKATEAQVSLNIEGAAFLPSGNRILLYELLYNLVDNGIKYNEPDGTVTINIRQQDGNIVLTVSDTGIGIPQTHQDRIFERFYRVDQSRSKKTGGTGLGLSIVKHAALIHGGSVEVSSQENAGTTVTVTLPLR